MKKVKVTREQAEAIEKFQKTVHELGISLDELKGIFESGYEVKPEFLVGDTVIHKETGVIEEVDGYMTTILEKHSDKYRHATPEEIAEVKERRWWAKHGREPWELKKGDVLVDADGGIVEVTGKRDDSKGFYINFCSYSLAMIKSRFIVLTFAENRLDVK